MSEKALRQRSIEQNLVNLERMKNMNPYNTNTIDTVVQSQRKNSTIVDQLMYGKSVNSETNPENSKNISRQESVAYQLGSAFEVSIFSTEDTGDYHASSKAAPVNDNLADSGKK